MIKYLMAITMLAFATPSMAQQVDPELAQWVERIDAQLSDNLDRTARQVGDSSGVVMLKFNCTEDGKAANVAVAKSSGNPRIDRAAIRAVNMVESFHPLPRGLGHGQPIMAVLSYDTSPREHEQRIAENRRIADAGNLWYHSDRYAMSELAPRQDH